MTLKRSAHSSTAEKNSSRNTITFMGATSPQRLVNLADATTAAVPEVRWEGQERRWYAFCPPCSNREIVATHAGRSASPPASDADGFRATHAGRSASPLASDAEGFRATHAGRSASPPASDAEGFRATHAGRHSPDDVDTYQGDVKVLL
eukprot:5057363-Pyramimonas_sp.AAC.1